MPCLPTTELDVLIDSREQLPFTFPASVGSYRIKTHRDTLPTGDYSIVGHAGRYGEKAGLCIERKKDWSELWKNTSARDVVRFSNELERMKAFDLRYLIVTQSADVLRMGQFHPSIDPVLLINRVLNLCESYGVKFYFAADHQAGERFALGVIKRYADRVGVYKTKTTQEIF
jgi:ERCC4-type nuclease